MRVFTVFCSIVLSVMSFAHLQAQTFEYADSIKNPSEYLKTLKKIEQAQDVYKNQEIDSVLLYYN